ncbi:MAG: cytochrome c [Planctomycetaceae bacterium]|nr:cytochrome c [Planctomycetaceae bacterium]
MSRALWMLFAAGGALMVGCGSGGKPPSKPETSAAPAAAPEQSTSSSSTSSSETRDSRTRWIGDVPYDVFYDRPLDVLGDTTPPVATMTPADSGDAVAPPQQTEGAPDSVAPVETPAVGNPSSPVDQGTVDWAVVAPIDRLEAETKEIRTRLSANLQTVATFNANVDGIETDGSILALIAAIIERHPQKVNWQDRARHVRQLGYDVYINASGKGRGPFTSTKEPFEKIVGILDGGPAPEIDAAEQIPLGEAGDRSQVMLRFETGFAWLRADINTPARLKEEKDRVIRETTVQAALATALTDASFDTTDQEQYQQFLQQFIAGEQAMTAAAELGDFTAYEQARDRVQKSCDACHLEYRNRSSE